MTPLFPHIHSARNDIIGRVLPEAQATVLLIVTVHQKSSSDSRLRSCRLYQPFPVFSINVRNDLLSDVTVALGLQAAPQDISVRCSYPSLWKFDTVVENFEIPVAYSTFTLKISMNDDDDEKVKVKEK